MKIDDSTESGELSLLEQVTPYIVMLTEVDDGVESLIAPHLKAMSRYCGRFINAGVITPEQADELLVQALSLGLANDTEEVLATLAAGCVLPDEFVSSWQFTEDPDPQSLNPFPHARISAIRQDGEKMWFPLYSLESALTICFSLIYKELMTVLEMYDILCRMKEMNAPLDDEEIDGKLTFMPPQMRDNFFRYVREEKQAITADLVAERMAEELAEPPEPAHFPGISATEKPN